MTLLEPNHIISADLERIAAADLPWPRLAGKTVIVTGGSGFLASYLVKSLLTAGDRHGLNLKVICVARSQRSVQARLAAYLAHPGLHVVTHDIAQPLPADVPAADFIIHSASQASPKYYGVDPVGTLMANSAGTMYLLNHAVRHRSSGFLFFSSGEVYGLPVNPDQPVTERDYGYIDPIQVRSCAQQHGLHASVVRPFHTYGPGMILNDGRVFADFVGDVVACRDIVLKSDGLAQRPFCYIADATEGFLTVLLKGESGHAYNVANPDTEISMRDLAHTVAGLFPERGVGVRFDIPPANNAYLKSPIVRACPSIAKINALGWQPIVGIAEGFGRTIQSFL
ncbi:MAG: NAD-dependent epimerase/dehydratase family protein [Betaproteobacteria bacterium]|nr:NAD-dependent epimerase/dehydratase family protein [Betaproteobacteria bacterium]